MKKSELKRNTHMHGWRMLGEQDGWENWRCECGAVRSKPVKRSLSRAAGKKSTTTTLKRGRGFAASPAQREKVKGMACVGCGAMRDDWTIIDPMHLCHRGRGGCGHPDCVVPGCRTATGGCHPLFDEGSIDLIAKLEPAFRAEVAHAVTHLGLEGTRRRLAPSLYPRGSERRRADVA